MAAEDAPFYPQIEAIDEYFRQFYNDYEYDWLNRNQINFQSVQSMWDTVNNVYDNLDDLDITLESLDEAVKVVEAMNVTIHHIQYKGTAAEDGMVFSGTRAEYESAGKELLEQLHQLEGHLAVSRKTLMDMAQKY